MSFTSRGSTKQPRLQPKATTVDKAARAANTTSSPSRPSSSDWLDLPAELMLLSVTRFLPNYRFLLVLSSVHRRLYELIHRPSVGGKSSASGPTSSSASSSFTRTLFWQHVGPVRVVLIDESQQRQVSLHVERYRAVLSNRKAAMALPRLLHSLRSVLACSLHLCAGYRQPFISTQWLQTCWQALGEYSHLTSLRLALDCTPTGKHQPPARQAAVDTLVTSLNSLHHLNCLELDGGVEWLISNDLPKALCTTLRRLCSEQLEHVALSEGWLQAVAWQEEQCSIAYPSMPRVRSFKFTSQFRHISAIASLAAFPSLTHVDLTSHQATAHIPFAQLPPVSSLRFNLGSLTTDTSTALPTARTREAAVSVLPVQTLCVLGTLTAAGSYQLRDLLSCTPDIQQFAMGPQAGQWRHSPTFFDTDVLAALHPLANLTYLQLDYGLCDEDWQSLLTPATPPAFATSLLHLALCCHPDERDTAAALLPSLPSMYPALTHCHVDGQVAETLVRGADSLEIQQWKAAVKALRTALGAVWCESAAEVVAWRADVMWRREAYIVAEADTVW